MIRALVSADERRAGRLAGTDGITGRHSKHGPPCKGLSGVNLPRRGSLSPSPATRRGYRPYRARLPPPALIGRSMRLTIDAHLDYELTEPADLLLALEVAQMHDQHLITDRLVMWGVEP